MRELSTPPRNSRRFRGTEHRALQVVLEPGQVLSPLAGNYHRQRAAPGTLIVSPASQAHTSGMPERHDGYLVPGLVHVGKAEPLGQLEELVEQRAHLRLYHAC